ncbi:MAG TPA: hypothetical protein PKC83_14570 [Gemmatimonadaceae bacterium]|nr:hypothetical protein [Gemmatimonadaceae bacterium]
MAFDEGPNEDGAMASQALAPLGDVVPIPVGDRLADLLRATRPDIVLNLARGNGSPERRLRVPASLEALDIPFCGSDSATHSTCVERPRLKATLAARGIPTATATVVDAPGQLAPFRHRAFPVAIRRARGVSSCFATLVAHDFDDLEAIVAELRAASDEPVLIERFLPGESFACTILGNGTESVALPVVSVPNDPYAAAPAVPWAKPVRIAHGLAEDIASIAMRAFHALGCRDVARIDIRLSDAGVPHVCGVEPVPAFTGRGDGAMISAARAAGVGEAELVQRCLVVAAAREGIRLPSAPALRRISRHTPPGVHPRWVTGG